MPKQDRLTNVPAPVPRKGASPPRCVVAIGPDATDVGGMASVVSQIQAMSFRGRYHSELFTLTRSTAPGESFHRRLRRHLTHLARLRSTLTRLEPAIVHIHTCSGFSFLKSAMDLLVARRCQCPVILHIHGAAFDAFYERQPRWRQALVRACLSRANGVIALSEEWKRRLTAMAPKARIVVIENAVESMGAARPTQSNGPCRFTLLARMDEWKGIDDLLDACALLARQDRPFELVLAGPAGTAGDAPTLNRKIANRDLGSAVRYVGVVLGNEKTKLLASADVYVQPSHHEGMPISLLEALASGLPIVATTVGAVPEVIEHERHGLLVPPHRPDSLASAMGEMIVNISQRNQMADAARELARARFSIHRFEQDLITLYDATLSALTSTGRHPDQPQVSARPYQEQCPTM